MREMGFSKRWKKLNDTAFTTFRLPRKDRDWAPLEIVKIIYHPRSKDRELLGVAKIVNKEQKEIASIRNYEAIIDGFPEGKVEMWRWLLKGRKDLSLNTMINKLTLRWID